jgi:hypothetical protein
MMGKQHKYKPGIYIFSFGEMYRCWEYYRDVWWNRASTCVGVVPGTVFIGPFTPEQIAAQAKLIEQLVSACVKAKERIESFKRINDTVLGDDEILLINRALAAARKKG